MSHRAVRIAGSQVPEILSDVPTAISVIEEFASQARARGADLVCFPECYLQGYDVTPTHVRETALDLASPSFAGVLRRQRPLEPVLVVGLIERDGAEFYNSAAVIRQGQVLGRYRKSHLLPAEAAVFAAGSGYPVFDVDGLLFGINICNDLNFPDAAEAVAQTGAVVLVAPCNNMLPLVVSEKWRGRHNSIRGRRARETGLWLVSSDVSGQRNGRVCYGPTAAIDPMGLVVDQVPLGTKGVVIVDVARRASAG